MNLLRLTVLTKARLHDSDEGVGLYDRAPGIAQQSGILEASRSLRPQPDVVEQKTF